MIVLDTNVISELMRRESDATVIAWLDAQPAESIWTTTITLFEVRFGLALLPAGKRRAALEAGFHALVSDELEDRLLEFDTAAAEAAASLGGLRQMDGRPMDMRDLQIAGIVLSRRATLATRNVKHFDGTGVPLLNPWL